MAGGLTEADIARMRRGGVQALTDERGLAFFDAALASGRAQALAVLLNAAALRAGAQAGALPPILSGLIRTPKRRSQATGSLANKLASLPEAEHESYVIDLVKAEVAAVLGHASTQQIDRDKAFREMGFDSLAAVELRNRLNTQTGLGLGAATVFDYPTPAALAGHLLAVTESAGKPSITAGLTQLEKQFAGLVADDPDRSKLAAHLRSLAADLESSGGAEAGDSDVSRLESASDEELLDFIDEQVGST
jgi:acyl carrier protein